MAGSLAVKTYRFKAVMQRFAGKGGFYFIAFPFNVEKEFQSRSSVRVKGMLNGVGMDRALKPLGDGTHYILISPELRRKAGLRLGTEADIVLRQNETPDELELPEELEAAFELEPEARDLFEGHIPSVRRGVIYWINSAKRPETRAQRAAEMLRRILTGTLHTHGK